MAEAELPVSPSPGEAIRRLRQLRGLSGRALGAAAQVSTGEVSKIETGMVEPSFRTFARLAVALAMTPLEIWVVVGWEGRRGVAVTPVPYGASLHPPTEGGESDPLSPVHADHLG